MNEDKSKKIGNYRYKLKYLGKIEGKQACNNFHAIGKTPIYN